MMFEKKRSIFSRMLFYLITAVLACFFTVAGGLIFVKFITVFFEVGDPHDIYVMFFSFILSGVISFRTFFSRPNKKSYTRRTSLLLENVRYNIALSCLVLGGSGPITLLVVWPLNAMINLETETLYIVYAVVYPLVVYFGFRSCRKSMRGKI